MTNAEWSILIDAIIGTMGLFSLFGLFCATSKCLKQVQSLWRKDHENQDD